jgi:hypothetical protein
LIDVLVRQEIILVSYECKIDHFDCSWRCELSVHWGWAWIAWYGKQIGFEEGVHVGGHGEAQSTVDVALWILQLLQHFDDMLVEGT